MTVGVVGGSDLIKISEQLGKTGLLYLALSFLLIRENNGNELGTKNLYDYLNCLKMIWIFIMNLGKQAL